MKYDIKKNTKSIVTVVRAWKLNFKKKNRNQRVNTLSQLLKDSKKRVHYFPAQKKENGSSTKKFMSKI